MTNEKPSPVWAIVQRRAVVACLTVRAEKLRWRGAWVQSGLAQITGATEVCAAVLDISVDHCRGLMEATGTPPWHVNRRPAWIEEQADVVMRHLARRELAMSQ